MTRSKKEIRLSELNLVDLLTEALSTLLAGLGTILTVIAGAAASRHRDARLAFVAGAQGLLAVIGFLSLLHQLSPLYGTAFGIDPIPLLVAVVAVGFLYAAMIYRRSDDAPRKHG